MINANQQWRHRGHRVINTSDVLAAARTFGTVANKKYHLRGTVTNGVNAYSLFDVTALPEADAQYDTTFDMMLIAAIETNGANVATVVLLANRNRLEASVAAELVNNASAGLNEHAGSFFATLNWARRPRHPSFMPLRRVWAQNETGPIATSPSGHPALRRRGAAPPTTTG